MKQVEQHQCVNTDIKYSYALKKSLVKLPVQLSVKMTPGLSSSTPLANR